MNYLPHIAILGWETRNWRHTRLALVWCKDYGFKPITKHIFIGELYAKEQRELEAKLKGLFAGKSEKFFIAALCKSCFNEGMVGIPRFDRIQSSVPFELVQAPKEG